LVGNPSTLDYKQLLEFPFRLCGERMDHPAGRTVATTPHQGANWAPRPTQAHRPGGNDGVPKNDDHEHATRTTCTHSSPLLQGWNAAHFFWAPFPAYAPPVRGEMLAKILAPRFGSSGVASSNPPTVALTARQLCVWRPPLANYNMQAPPWPITVCKPPSSPGAPPRLLLLSSSRRIIIIIPSPQKSRSQAA
jgi:hypothetical protein